MYLYQTKNVVYGVACFIHADLDRFVLLILEFLVFRE